MIVVNLIFLPKVKDPIILRSICLFPVSAEHV